MKIFIATASKYLVKTDNDIDIERTKKGKLKPIFDAQLKCQNISFVPWYDDTHKTFLAGKTFLESLILVSKKYNGGIFVLGDDIEDAKSIPNLNVLLEAGMFLSSKGISRTFFVVDDLNFNEINKKLSDLKGYNISKLSDKNLAQKICDFFIFSSEKFNSPFDKVSYFISNHISEKIKNKDYQRWETKGLYIGNKSARYWDEIESSRSYYTNVKALKVFFSHIVNDNLIDLNNIDNVVSFGCGNGKTDYELLKIIIRKNDSICYIPVDINPLLIYYSTTHISKKIRVPFSIVDDFEENVDHIRDIINGKKEEIGEKNLFIMLGVTFSNLEKTEQDIFSNLKKWMSENDYFLIDVSLNQEKDQKYLIKALDDKGYKKLLYNSLLKKNVIDYSKSIDEINFDIVKLKEPIKNSYSDLESTNVYAYKYKGNTVFISKRYKYKEIEKIISDNFKLIYSQSVISQSNRKKAFFLFKLKN